VGATRCRLGCQPRVSPALFVAGFGALDPIAGIAGGGGRVAGAVDRLRPPAAGIEVLHLAVEITQRPTGGGAYGQGLLSTAESSRG